MAGILFRPFRAGVNFDLGNEGRRASRLPLAFILRAFGAEGLTESLRTFGAEGPLRNH